MDDEEEEETQLMSRLSHEATSKPVPERSFVITKRTNLDSRAKTLKESSEVVYCPSISFDAEGCRNVYLLNSEAPRIEVFTFVSYFCCFFSSIFYQPIKTHAHDFVLYRRSIFLGALFHGILRRLVMKTSTIFLLFLYFSFLMTDSLVNIF